MRGLAYAIAVIAAVGIMIAIATTPQQPVDDLSSPPAIAASATSEVMTEAGTLTISVPNMHCEFACFPRVKETIEHAAGVQEVQLAAQKEEGTIDNRQVVVKYDPGFDVASTLTLLAEEGFPDSDVVQ